MCRQRRSSTLFTRTAPTAARSALGVILGIRLYRPVVVGAKVDGLQAFGDVQLAWFAVKADATPIIDAEGDVTILLDLYCSRQPVPKACRAGKKKKVTVFGVVAIERLGDLFGLHGGFKCGLVNARYGALVEGAAVADHQPASRFYPRRRGPFPGRVRYRMTLQA